MGDPQGLKHSWHLDMGASITSEGLRFRVWAPLCRRVAVDIQWPVPVSLPMACGADGVWEAVLPNYGAGTRYTFRLHETASLPDPYSRSQPLGVHGPSEVVDASVFAWTDQSWHGVSMQGLVIYECHIGTATPAGTCEALIEHLGRLAELGISAIELMPVAAFPGQRNWGYDGVYLFTVSANYGGPEGLKRLVNAAHGHGLGVILDVVYNHLGPDGNYLPQFSPYYFSTRYRTPWGEALNYDGEHSRRVRQLAIDNACYWLHEYHIDGLRLDATGKIFDASQPHVLQELSRTVHASLPPDRQIVLIAETSENDVRYLLPADAGGHGFDAVWVDDFYWTLRRYATGDHEGRYQDYHGSLEEVAQTINQGFLYEGAWSSYVRSSRGTSARLQPGWNFQYCLQHHDHVGNRAFGDRLHHQVDLDWFRVASTVLLLLPFTPLIFMGQEFVASAPFLFFTDHQAELGRLVTQGRQREFAIYSAFADASLAARIPDPQAEETFLRSKLPLHELQQSPGCDIQQLYRELLHLRRNDSVLCTQSRQGIQASAPTPDLLTIVWRQMEGLRLLLANFGLSRRINLLDLWRESPVPHWQIRLETSAARFGGSGQRCGMADGSIALPPQSAVFLTAEVGASR